MNEHRTRQGIGEMLHTAESERLAAWSAGCAAARRLAVYAAPSPVHFGPPPGLAWAGSLIPAYRDSMTSAYLAAIGARLSFMVG
jgi:hypothetical protein